MKKAISALLVSVVAFGACAADGGPTDFRGLFPPDVKTVGIVSVSYLIPKDVFARGTNLLAEAGYRVKVMPNVLTMEDGPHLRVTEKVPKAEVGRVIDELICRKPAHGR